MRLFEFFTKICLYFIKNLIHKKIPNKGIFLYSKQTHKPNSVCKIIIYLTLLLPGSSSGLPNLALHSSKNLAVSPIALLRQLALHHFGAGRFKPFGFKRLCSHLDPYGRRVLPATIFDNSIEGIKQVFGLSSPPFGLY